METNDLKTAFKVAIRKLSLRAMHSSSLKEALLEKGYSIDVINETISHVIKSGYVKDEEWISNFVKNEEKKGHSLLQIQGKLWTKKIDFSKQDILNCFDEEKALTIALRKKGYFSANNEKRKKIRASLLRLGFNFRKMQEVENEEIEHNI